MLSANAGAVLAERELALSAEPAGLETARRFFDAAAADFGLDDRGRYQVTTATHEAVANAIRHGAPFPRGLIYLGATAHEGDLVCSIYDRGSFQPRATAPPGKLVEHGRGFPLMRVLMDEVAIETGSNGTVVRLRKRRRPNPGVDGIAAWGEGRADERITELRVDSEAA